MTEMRNFRCGRWLLQCCPSESRGYEASLLLKDTWYCNLSSIYIAFCILVTSGRDCVVYQVSRTLFAESAMDLIRASVASSKAFFSLRNFVFIPLILSSCWNLLSSSSPSRWRISCSWSCCSIWNVVKIESGSVKNDHKQTDRNHLKMWEMHVAILWWTKIQEPGYSKHSGVRGSGRILSQKKLRSSEVHFAETHTCKRYMYVDAATNPGCTKGRGGLPHTLLPSSPVVHTPLTSG